jgi:hypothetical protein
VVLRLWDDDETPGQINDFLSHYSTLNQLINLQSLSLSKIDCEQTMNEIMNKLCHFSNLIHLNIVDSCHFEAQHLDIIWSLPKLRHCKLGKIFHMYLSESPRVISFSLVNVSIWCSGDYRASVNRLLKCTPNLQHLSMSLIDPNCDQISFSIPSMKSLKIFVEDFASSLKSLLSHMINLSKLNVNIWDIHLDGYRWEKIIRRYLPKLKIFQFSMSIPSRNNIDCEQKVDEILNSFRTDFWLNEHRWFVRCHWNPDEDDFSGYYLYTLPYTSNILSHRMGKCFKSTCPNEDDYSSYDCVQILNYSFASRFDSRLFFPKLHELSLTFPSEENFWSIIPTLDQLTTLHLNIENDDDQWQTLLDKTPRLYSLELTSNSITNMLASQISNKSIRRLDFEYIDGLFNEETCNALIHSPLGIQCELLTIKVENSTNIILLVNHMKNLRALKVQCGDEISSYQARELEKDRLVKWLQQNLSLTCIISKETYSHFIRLWIR